MTSAPAAALRVIVWGSELSPYTLKLGALLAYAERPFRLFPVEGRRRETLAALLRIELAKRRRTIARYPAISVLDEYPLVPFLLSAHGVSYDSSALARWLDDLYPPPPGALVPGDPSLAFAVHLVDEAFDEFGLYLVHHARWVISARTNDAGRRLAREFAPVLLPGAGSGFARRFAARQVRRLPYLFSVAPADAARDGLAPELTPPRRDGFPPTHRMLAHAWEAYLDGVESVVREQPYLFGERFTLADASVYGQLGMNLKDPTAAEIMQRQAPATFRWLCAIRDRRHVGSRGALAISTRLRSLLDAISRTFLPLMAQNAAAYDAARAGGETLFNERAFDRGRALYEGTLLGSPFRSVVKTFQVRVWRELCAAWRVLDDQARIPLLRVLPPDTPLTGTPSSPATNQ